MVDTATQLHESQAATRSKVVSKTPSITAPTKVAIGFLQKCGEHWLILVAALFFDLIALIPAVSIITNPVFGGILFLYFGPKSKGGEFLKIALPVAGGTALDSVSSFIPGLDLIPLNIGVALIRIAAD